MKKSLLSFPIAVISLYLALYGNVSFSRAEAQQIEKVELTNFSGDTEVLLEDLDEYAPAQEGMILQAGDKIKTAGSSSAELSFNEDNTNVVRLNESTNVEVSLSQDEKLAMTEGEIFASISELPSGSAFEIRTPTAVSGARGTDWVTKVTEEGTDVEAVESTPYVRHFEADGSISQQRTSIEPGQMTTVRKFQRPMPSRPIPDARRQQWQNVKQEVRRNAGEAVIKRQQRQPFDRKDFLQKFKEGGGPNKSIFKPTPGGERDDSGVLISRDQKTSPGEKNKSITPKAKEKKLKIESEKPADLQSQSKEVGLGKQVKSTPKKAITLKSAAKEIIRR
jgi:hypothetical protein